MSARNDREHVNASVEAQQGILQRQLEQRAARLENLSDMAKYAVKHIGDKNRVASTALAERTIRKVVEGRGFKECTGTDEEILLGVREAFLAYFPDTQSAAIQEIFKKLGKDWGMDIPDPKRTLGA